MAGVNRPRALSGENALDARRKRILFRSCHRGMQETDILLGGFAKRRIGDLSDDQLDRLEILLDQSDNDLYDWISGRSPVPPELDDDVMKLIKNFNNNA